MMLRDAPASIPPALELEGRDVVKTPKSSNRRDSMGNADNAATAATSALISMSAEMFPPKGKKLYSLCQLLGLLSISFSYAFVFNTVNAMVIPKEIERLAPSRQSIWVGCIMALGAVFQLSTPIVGAWSDRAGQRTSFLIYGSFVTILGVVCFLVAGTMHELLMLFPAHVVTTVGLSVQYSMLTALLNDHVADEQVGKGSGALAILAILGSGAGYAMFASNVPLAYSFGSYILATVCCLGISVVYIPLSDTTARNDTPNASVNEKPKRCCKAISEYICAPLAMPSPRRYPDFFFACLGRALFNAGLASQVYLVYYFRDVLKVTNTVQVTSVVSVAALVGGVLGALPAGMASDRFGRKPVIYVAVAVCVASLVLFLTTFHTTHVQLIGFVYGIGNIAYLSVDYALGVQSLPRKHVANDSDEPQPGQFLRGAPLDPAKDLGVFAVASTVGNLIGQIIYAVLLDGYGTLNGTNVVYSHSGFLVIYGASALFFIGSGVSTAFIRGVK